MNLNFKPVEAEDFEEPERDFSFGRTKSVFL